MGHKVERTVYRLRFTGPPLAGATIRARALPLGRYLDLARLRVAWIDGGRKEEVAYLDALFDDLAKALVDWDLLDEDTGEPIPCDRAGVDSLDDGTALLIGVTWLDTFVAVPADDPLPDGSPNGEPFPEPSIPMEPLSPSPTS
jgi:hypothetical protein